MAASSQVFFSFLSAFVLTSSHWRAAVTDDCDILVYWAGNIPFLGDNMRFVFLEWFPVVQSLEGHISVWGSGDCCHLRRAHVEAPVTDSSCWVVSKAARSADFITFLFSHWRLCIHGRPREWLLVCAGPLLHPEWAWEEPGDLADPHRVNDRVARHFESQSDDPRFREKQIHVWSPCSEDSTSEDNSFQGAFQLRSYLDHLLMNQKSFRNALKRSRNSKRF